MATATSLQRMIDRIQWDGDIGSNPDRVLCLAVLERAVRDLSPKMENDIRRDAINWFLTYCRNGQEKDSPDTDISTFSFQSLIHILDLDDGQVWYLCQLAIEADIQYEKDIERLWRGNNRY